MKRILVVVDGLSEMSGPVQEHVRGIHGKANRINALLVTSRTRQDFGGVPVTVVSSAPGPLENRRRGSPGRRSGL